MYGPRLGPVYTVDGVFQNGDKLQVVLKRTFWHQIQLPIPMPFEAETATAVATISVPAEDSKLASFDQVRAVDRIGSEWYAWYDATPDPHTWLRQQFNWLRPGEQIDLVEDGRATKRLLDIRDEAIAVSSSGRMLLCVGRDSASLLDLSKSGATVWVESDGPLSTILRTVQDHRGQDGDWFVSDDGKSVGILPPLQVVKNGIWSDQNEPMNVMLLGRQVDLEDQAVWFDCAARTISVVPSELRPAEAHASELDRKRVRLQDVTSARDGPLLLFPDAISNSTGRVLYIGSFGERSVGSEGGSFSPDRGHHCICWDPTLHRIIRVSQLGEVDRPEKHVATGGVYAIENLDYEAHRSSSLLINWPLIREAVDSVYPIAR